jgi:wobble nucleotide-excising tRNase
VNDPEDRQGAEKAFNSLEQAAKELESNVKKITSEQESVEKSLENEIYRCR